MNGIAERFPTPPPAIPDNVYDPRQDGPRTRRDGRPTWYGQRVAREERPWSSWTGDVELIAGRRFPKSYATLAEAMTRAESAAQGVKGAVAVLQAGERFHVARLYNAERDGWSGFRMVQTDLRADRRLTNLHAGFVALVDDDITVGNRGRS